MTARRHRNGQVAIFLVLILAGLALLLALNVDVFTSSRAKIRLQNAADASALALARWQGATLNMIGDLNLARLAAVCQSNENAIAGIGQLQSRLAFIGPTIGFKAANDLAEKNGVRILDDLTAGMHLVSGFMDEGYRKMLEVVLRDGIRAGIDNAAIFKAGNVDPRTDPDFYEAIQSRDFRTLCCRFGGGAHRLPDIPSEPLDQENFLISGVNACFGSTGIGWESGTAYGSYIPELANLARDCGLDGNTVTIQGLVSNSYVLAKCSWCVYDPSEWRDFPADFGFSRFPWLTPFRDEYAVCGGSSTVRLEGYVSLASLTAQTNFIAAQAAAKVFGSVNGRKVTSVTPPIVLPAFSRTRLVPFAVGAAGRHGMANINHIRSALGLLGKPGGASSYLHLLETYRSEGFRQAAEKWYSEHGHRDADGCRPPGGGTERGGGTPYGI